MGIPDYLICLLRNLYAGQEATARIHHETKDWFKIRKGVDQGYILSPCLFYDPKDVGNFISGSSAFSKSSLYIWNSSVHVLLKPSLKDLEHYLASMWDQHNGTIV